ncbi:FHA domain-containing protein [candidate division KSB1 bacterium]|nr:FHA domain-containing protein [candidate division KSB1 bacterium]NIR70740.1 FHA domain-containing protein [candidate division KSB1 bacterium]NIS24598.1 FHA domain-containing protein [candidate division KSB1 bacterium]NIT71507.1 FHA domain-containing protein [candidate division KSB1 bacterium]NIU25198.1 FHA domain-containing protein [candidate division KSB1 bacterium]
MSEALEMTPEGVLITKEPVNLPEVLDVLIVGGGPGGTAAAFRAKELGISALVIDFDDILKRIRDYAKDKLILPDFGGGDKMKFPKGGDLVSLLHFSPIDKDDMHIQWKSFYKDNNIAAQIGVELTGIEQGKDGIWNVKSWNHTTKKEQFYKAKHIILAIGRGVPRRFDIPGNTDGIAYRLADPAAYVGTPACVVGGGTSAAEAVIAISNAKIEAKDPSAVYWSYRGANMPKVSKALADVFFDAYVGNGNIRYFPKSEPVAIVTAEDRKEYLAIRTDRKFIEHRPNETQHIEFAKERCIACIGEDIPEGFLNSMGIEMGTGGPNNKKRMLVTRNLETQQPNVYLVGDILSQAYFETDDFKADPSAYREIKHRGNVKSALRDGVFIMQVIKQRLEGKTDVEVTLEEAEEIVEKAKEKAKEKSAIDVAKPVDKEGPPEESVEPSREVEEGRAWLVHVVTGNVEDNEHPVKTHGITTIGRKECDITYPEDTLLSDKHASISHTEDGYFLRDDGSANGVFLKATEARHLEVQAGNLVRLGKQFLLFTSSNGEFGFVHYDHTGKEVNRHKIPDKTIVLGRQAPDITLDSQDMSLSRRHMAISLKENRVFIKDLKSVNGSYLKVKNAVKLEHGDQFRVGQQVFNFTLKADAVLDTGLVSIPPVKPKAEEKAPAAQEKPQEEEAPKEEAAAPTGPAVTIKNVGKTFSIEEGQTICELAEENDIEFMAECHSGVCGSDPIRVISGKENLNELNDQEKETIEDLCSLDPNECRMACMVKVKGPVEVEFLEN